MRRREFIAMLGGAAAWPFPAAAQIARPQPSTLPTIGFLNNLSPDLWQAPMSGFLRGLNEAGYVEAQNVAFAYRWTEGRSDRLPELAADLVQANVAVMIASADTATALAALAATSKIPVVFATRDDPVRLGLVSSLDQPGGRATGMYLLKPVSDGPARQALLRQLVPDNQIFHAMDILDTSSVVSQTEPEAAFENTLAPSNNPHIIKGPVRAIMIHSGPFLDTRRRNQLVALPAQHRIPTLYDWRVFAEEGGLISYGISIEETYSRIGRYAGEILKGRSPADMPVLKPAKFETVVNLRTAAQLGLKVPPELLASADKVIE